MESGNSLLQIPKTGLSNGVLHFSIAGPVLKLCMLKVACLQGHYVMGKNDQVPEAFKAHSKKMPRYCTFFP